MSASGLNWSLRFNELESFLSDTILIRPVIAVRT